MTFKTLFMAASFAVASVGTLQAATFTFEASVYDTVGPASNLGDPNFPPLGAPATVTLNINDSNPLLPVLSSPVTVEQVFSASLNVPGFLGGSMANGFDLSDFSLTAEELRFSAYGPSFIADPGAESYRFEGLHVFRVNFGAPLASVPVTVGEVVTAISAPGASGLFSHELEADSGGQFVFTRASFPAEAMEVVPLPASGVLLAMAIGGFGWAARRRKSG